MQNLISSHSSPQQKRTEIGHLNLVVWPSKCMSSHKLFFFFACTLLFKFLHLGQNHLILESQRSLPDTANLLLCLPQESVANTKLGLWTDVGKREEPFFPSLAVPSAEQSDGFGTEWPLCCRDQLRCSAQVVKSPCCFRNARPLKDSPRPKSYAHSSHTRGRNKYRSEMEAHMQGKIGTSRGILLNTALVFSSSLEQQDQ